jgi:nitrogen-specific signal transduction histidine kinase/ActR/RegA family two-component response regulator
MLVDITERRKMEEEMIRREKLDSIGLLAGGIAHDFNNILTTILGNISLSLSSTESGSELNRWLSDAEKASLQARNLTHQLLTFAKGGTPVTRAASATDIIRESARFALHGSNVGCKFDLPEDLPAVDADVGQINQVLSNVIINADQAMPGGGEINISARAVKIKKSCQLPLKSGDFVKIEVKDRGIGIAPQHLSKIFDPFFTTKQKGNGLGLATAYSIIKKHNGHLLAESELGEGSRFTVYLPVADGPAVMPEKSNMQYNHLENMRILVMDDDELIRTMIIKALLKCSCSVDVADDGRDAIEMYKSARTNGRPYDLVIMDLTVPGGMGGREAILVLREIDPHIKAIVSSGYSSNPIMSKPKDYGFDAGIAKPFKVDDLYKTISDVLTEKSAVVMV